MLALEAEGTSGVNLLHFNFWQNGDTPLWTQQPADEKIIEAQAQSNKFRPESSLLSNTQFSI